MGLVGHCIRGVLHLRVNVSFMNIELLKHLSRCIPDMIVVVVELLMLKTSFFAEEVYSLTNLQ